VAARRKMALVVGSGFTYALTAGSDRIVGHDALPTLDGLSQELVKHIDQAILDGASFEPVSPDLVTDTLSYLRTNSASFNFEELISKLATQSALVDTGITSKAPKGQWSSHSLFRCLLFLLYDLFAQRLSYQRKREANRNFFYRINAPDRADEFRRAFYRFSDNHDVTFISFNYDGLVEAFLDCELGKQPPTFRYFPEISHGVQIVMPEHYMNEDHRDMSKWRVPLVLKPHGSIHFFAPREDINSLRSAANLIAVHPRPDLLFDPARMQRDIPDQDLLRYADPVPYIVPPVFNKEKYFGDVYAQVVLKKTVAALREAEYILGLGLSIPKSDLHVNALFEAANDTPKQIGICYRSGGSDRTVDNWQRCFPNSTVTVLASNGMPTDSPATIQQFWDSAFRWLEN
jgi:hypothetical protein